jgi:alpha-ketoglutarate-dependent taurine dioxygenase
VAACEDLPARVRTRLEKLRAAHSYEQLTSSFQRFAGGTAKTLSGARKEALYHLVGDGSLYLAPHAISKVVDETGKEIAASELVDALAAWCTRPEYVHAHAWEPGDYVRHRRADQISLRLLDGAELPRHRRDDGS